MGQTYSVFFNAFHSIRRAPLLVRRAIFGEQKLIKLPEIESTPPAPISFQSLPVEILLHVFSFLELKPYIISHGVCKDWQHLLPLTELHPIRRRMLALYHKMISTPDFTKTRPWTLENLQLFDRQAYIDTLLAQYPAVPDEFRMWILEWPNCLAIACTWPALPFFDSRAYDYERRRGVNWLGYHHANAPELFAVLYRNETPDVKVMPALLIWREHVAADWLIFDEDEPDLFGRVYVTDFMDQETSAVIPHKALQDHQQREYVICNNKLYADWISYMEWWWDDTVDTLGRPHESNPFRMPDQPISLPVELRFNHTLEYTLPTYQWSLRDDVLKLAQYK